MTGAAGVLLLKMVIAAFSGMGAATICHPLDVIKTQMQTEGSSYSSFTDAAMGIYTKNGIKDGLYAGVSAAYLRQWLYGSCRIGIYAYLLESAQNANVKAGLDKNAISLSSKMLMGLTSGGIGSFVGTPSELALVRMSNDKKLPTNERRNYNGVVECIGRIAHEEGIPALWTGAPATVLRACLLSACAMGITSEAKMKLASLGVVILDGKSYGGVPLLFAATLISSLAANVVANPFDVVKSRMQQDATGKYANGMLDCFLQIVGGEGVLKLWSGFVPAFLKLAPYTVISLLLTDKITKILTGKEAL
jgi:solute carrier family 25 oxoglutarate transporter 11